jgi:phosphatidylglycerol:prolipoprotein diacylglycerol transferase
MIFPNIDPVAISIGPIHIRWYALAYVAGIVLAYVYVSWLNRRQPRPLLTDAARDDLILYAVLGIMLGGRVGYALFYNLPFFVDNPLEIFAVWRGGMAFHGGLLGVLVSFYFFARRHAVSWMALMDLLATATPIGLFLGRLANFVNGELYGRVTTSALGMVFPNGGPVARYPSQLFEAALEGLVLFIVLFLTATRSKALQMRGLMGGLFLSGYGLSRFIIEFFREPDGQLGTFAFDLSMGQILSLPMMVFGLWLVGTAHHRPLTARQAHD